MASWTQRTITQFLELRGRVLAMHHILRARMYDMCGWMYLIVHSPIHYRHAQPRISILSVPILSFLLDLSPKFAFVSNMSREIWIIALFSFSFYRVLFIDISNYNACILYYTCTLSDSLACLSSVSLVFLNLK